MALREIGLQNVRLRRHPTTFDEAIDSIDSDFMRMYDLMRVPIREVLTGRAFVNRFSDSSQLEVMIHQIEVFFDQERENWVRSKHRYQRIEKQLARTLMVAIRAIRKNIVWNVTIKPPVDQETYLRLMLSYGFEPFHYHWTLTQKNSMRQKMSVIRFYYEHFNRSTQEDMRRIIDANDSLFNV